MYVAKLFFFLLTAGLITAKSEKKQKKSEGRHSLARVGLFIYMGVAEKKNTHTHPRTLNFALKNKTKNKTIALYNLKRNKNQKEGTR